MNQQTIQSCPLESDELVVQKNIEITVCFLLFMHRDEPTSNTKNACMMILYEQLQLTRYSPKFHQHHSLSIFTAIRNSCGLPRNRHYNQMFLHCHHKKSNFTISITGTGSLGYGVIRHKVVNKLCFSPSSTHHSYSFIPDKPGRRIHP